MALYWTALVLVVIGALNWGLVGLFNVDLVASLFGTMTPLSRTVYAIVGLSGLILAATASTLAGRSTLHTTERHQTIG